MSEFVRLNRFTVPFGAILASLAMQATPAFAGTLAGTWTFTYEVNDRPVSADVDFAETEAGGWDANWTAKWPDDGNQPNFDPSEISFKVSDIKVEDQTLSFKRSMTTPDWSFESDFKGTLDGDKLAGTFSSDWGETDVTATRAQQVASNIFGKWELTSEGRDGTPRTRVLTLNDDMTGAYEGRDNEEAPIQNVTYENDTLGFKVEREFQGNSFVSEFKGTVKGDSLEGEFTSSRGSRPVTGKKVVPAAESR